MGMPIQITYAGDTNKLLESQITNNFDALDAQFSTYKATSDVSLYAKKQLPKAKQNKLFIEVIQACKLWKLKTKGAFDAYYNQAYDPSGYVKALAIQQTSQLIEAAGIFRYLINASGDILAVSDSQQAWSIALQHPLDKLQSIGTIKAQNLAIASSGSYERGNHIINPKTGQPTNFLLGITVIGQSIITSDVLATAAFASDSQWNSLIDQFDGYEALAILVDGTVQLTPGFEALVN